jgi:hypothetical protein
MQYAFQKNWAACALVGLIALTACGGGSDLAPKGTTAITADEAKIFAQFEMSMAWLSHRNTLNLSMLGQSLNLLSLDPSLKGNSPPRTTNTYTLPCTSGSATAILTQTTAHAGLAAGDQVSINYAQCTMPSAEQNSPWTGEAKLTLTQWSQASLDTSQLPTRSTPTYTANFTADLKALVMSQNGQNTRYDGSMSLVTQAQIFDGWVDSNLTVPVGRQLKITESATGKPDDLAITYNATANVITRRNVSSNTSSLQLNGNLDFAIPGFDSKQEGTSFNLATPVALAGTTTNAFLQPSVGLIRMTVTPLPSEGNAFTVSVNAKNATQVTIQTDTDNNGSFDLTFDTTWLRLLSLSSYKQALI